MQEVGMYQATSKSVWQQVKDGCLDMLGSDDGPLPILQGQSSPLRRQGLAVTL